MSGQLPVDTIALQSLGASGKGNMISQWVYGIFEDSKVYADFVVMFTILMIIKLKRFFPARPECFYEVKMYRGSKK